MARVCNKPVGALTGDNATVVEAERMMLIRMGQGVVR